MLKEIELKNLVENKYNPRRRFDDAAMQDLKDSIDARGSIIQPLTVRNISKSKGKDENKFITEKYEVVAGIRRLKALKGLFNENKKIPCNIVDADDEEARIISISENIAREELTSIEEARAFANFIKVEDPNDKMKKISFLESVEKGDGQARDKILVPSKNHKDVVSLSKNLAQPGKYSASKISGRLHLLLLPSDLQTAVENKNLGIELGEALTRLRGVYNAEERMKILADEYVGKLGHETRRELSDRIKDIIDNDRREREQEGRIISEMEDLVKVREDDLVGTIRRAKELFNDLEKDPEGKEKTNEEENEDIDKIIEEGDIKEIAQNLINEINSKVGAITVEHEKLIDDKIVEFTYRRDRLSQNEKEIRKHSLTRCPYCGAGVNAGEIGKRIPVIDSEIESLKTEIAEVGGKKKELKTASLALREKKDDYTNANDRLDKKRGKTEVKPENGKKWNDKSGGK